MLGHAGWLILGSLAGAACLIPVPESAGPPRAATLSVTTAAMARPQPTSTPAAPVLAPAVEFTPLIAATGPITPEAAAAMVWLRLPGTLPTPTEGAGTRRFLSARRMVAVYPDGHITGPIEVLSNSVLRAPRGDTLFGLREQAENRVVRTQIDLYDARTGGRSASIEVATPPAATAHCTPTARATSPVRLSPASSVWRSTSSG